MSSTSSDAPPIPIHRLAHHYYLYSTPSISSLRATHSIPGTLIGTLPQCPQQNVFLGLPLLLSYSEARRLVTTGAAYIVDDVEVHKAGLKNVRLEEKQRWLRGLREEGLEVARGEWERKVEERQRVLGGLDEGKRERVREVRRREKEKKAKGGSKVMDKIPSVDHREDRPEAEEDTIFTSSTATAFFAQDPLLNVANTLSSTTSTLDFSSIPSSANTPYPTPPPDSPSPSTPKPQDQDQDALIPHAITPTLSTPLISPPPPSSHAHAHTYTHIAHHPHPPKPQTHLHAHLHSHSYFLLPGLRFGAHFNAYPGDPLRFHAHFACRAYGWEEAVPLLEIVGGGRLGTGVKKGFLIGGDVGRVGGGGGEGRDGGRGDWGAGGPEEDGRETRCFTVEWGGM